MLLTPRASKQAPRHLPSSMPVHGSFLKQFVMPPQPQPRPKHPRVRACVSQELWKLRSTSQHTDPADMHEGELLLRDVLLQWPSLMDLDEDLANILDLDEPLLEEMHKDLAADKAKTNNNKYIILNHII